MALIPAILIAIILFLTITSRGLNDTTFCDSTNRHSLIYVNHDNYMHTYIKIL